MSDRPELPRHTRTVTLGELVERLVGSAHGDLTALAGRLPGQPETNRKRELARYLHNLRQRLVRLAILVNTAPVQNRAKISVLCGDMLGVLKQHERAFTDTADRLFALHGQMAWAKAPLYDLPGALDVLCNGTYSCLPASIADVAPMPSRVHPTGDPGGDASGPTTAAVGRSAADDAKDAAEARAKSRRVEREIRGRLLQMETPGGAADGSGSRPPAMRVWGIADGSVVLGVPGEYRATVTLGGPPPLPPSPPPPPEGEAAAPPPVKPPPPCGGWLVTRVEMLAGERIDGGGTRRFALSDKEQRILCERSTARMAGMSPPPPALPEVIEGGAQGLSGLHYVCHGAALRIAAGAALAQSKRVGRLGIRVEHIKKPAAAAVEGEAGEDEKEGVAGAGAPRARVEDEGIGMWFWLPRVVGPLGAAGVRLAGVDVGSVEGGKIDAAAVDSAVARGALPRVELTYVPPREKESASGTIQAVAIIPKHEDDGVGAAEVESVALPFDTAAVDIPELLADGIREASKMRLARVLNQIIGACRAMGVDASLDAAAVHPAATATATPFSKTAGDPKTAADAESIGGGGGDLFEVGGEDGWGASPRPAIVVRLTSRGTTVQVTCGKRDGGLMLIGCGALMAPAGATALVRAVRAGGGDALAAALASLRRAALEHDLRNAVRALGHHPHPAPQTLRPPPGGWPHGGVPPAVLLPVAPTSAGCYVAIFISDGDKKEGEGVTSDGHSGASHSMEVLHTRRVNAAARAEVVSCAPLATGGALRGSKKRKAPSAESGRASEAMVPERVAESVSAAVERETVTAQRLAVARWLTQRGLRFEDVRPARANGRSDGFVPHSALTFSARLGDGAWGAEDTAAVEIFLRGSDGIRAVVRSTWSPPRTAKGEDFAVAALVTTPAPAIGGTAEVQLGPDQKGCVVTLDYPGAGVEGGIEFGPGAACADVHRAVAALAFLRSMTEGFASGLVRVIALEPLSVLIGVTGRNTVLRVGWVGSAGPAGGLAAAEVKIMGETTLTAEKEAALSEAARVCDVKAFCEALSEVKVEG